jgi:hypothetical protein
MTSTWSARPDSIRPQARSSADSQPTHAALTSIAATVMPSAWATSGAQAGVISSAASVATRTRSRSGGAAGGGREVAQPLVRPEPAAVLDAGALLDPRAVHAQRRADDVVRDDRRGERGAEPGDAGGADLGRGVSGGRLDRNLKHARSPGCA